MAAHVFNVKHGGLIRWSGKIAAAETTAWNKGRVLTLSSVDGGLTLHAGASGTIAMIALENRALSTSVGPTSTLTVVGAPTGEKKSVIVDKAVIVTSEVASGSSWNPGDKVYVSSTGYIADGDRARYNTNSVVIGFALDQGRAGDDGNPLEFYFDVSY